MVVENDGFPQQSKCSVQLVGKCHVDHVDHRENHPFLMGAMF
jgi:hypothetical protein